MEEYTVEIDSDVYNQDYDIASPAIEETENKECDIAFE